MITIEWIDREGASYFFDVPRGTNLRKALLDNGHTPYTSLTQRLNCGGRGLCATCGVWVETTNIPPAHWHDRLAHQFGYPRLSCQITIQHPLRIRQVEKWIWGSSRSAP